LPRTGAHYAGKDVTAMTPEEYQALVKRMAPRSPILRDTALAFLVGGAICVVGQLLSHWYGTLGLDDSDAGTATSVTLVFLSALATGLGLYHKLARWAGAGTLVPITGFANAVASPAVDFQTEVRCIIGIVRENRNR
jgi:stage V sporulation protein AC